MKKFLFKIVGQYKIRSGLIWQLLILISSLMLNFSCSKNDDPETIGLETIVDNPSVDNSNIIYTNIEPDYVSNYIQGDYELDLNNDGIADYYFSLWNDSFSEYLLLRSSPNRNNSFIVVTPWYANTLPLLNGSLISDLKEARNGEYYEKWGVFSIGNCFGGGTSCEYDWTNKSDMYLGFRIVVDGKYHYGWARMDVKNTTNWAIKDYAYNAVPYKPILAGRIE